MKRLALPIAIGVCLGLMSVLIGLIPPAIALWSGMILLGNHFGYVLGALVVAYLNAHSWKQCFCLSTLTIIIASFVYYFIIQILQSFGAVYYVNSVLYALLKLVLWSVTGAVCGALAATVMRFARYGKTFSLRIGALITAYLAVLWVIYSRYARTIIEWYNDPLIRDRGYTGGYYFAGRNFEGDIFAVAFAFLITTTLLVIAVRKAINERHTTS